MERSRTVSAVFVGFLGAVAAVCLILAVVYRSLELALIPVLLVAGCVAVGAGMAVVWLAVGLVVVSILAMVRHVRQRL